ncbi:MAG: hypothetical protein JWO64_943 [Hyphomicrobiales bacterium]|nr:hypothetical protein [Hyphomicrobiales bacterium]
MPLLDSAGLRADVWDFSEDGSSSSDNIIVGLAHVDAALAGNGRGRKVGVAIANHVKASALDPFLDQIELVSIAFPNHGDGRGFSIARQLRALGFKGVLRASGPLIADQFAYALACGFDEIDLPESVASRQPVAQWLAMNAAISHTYQRGYGARNILDARRAARTTA